MHNNQSLVINYILQHTHEKPCRYGGIYERGSKEYTLDDFYSLQLDKLDRYTCLKESDLVISAEGEEESSSDDDESDDEDSDTDEEMEAAAADVDKGDVGADGNKADQVIVEETPEKQVCSCWTFMFIFDLLRNILLACTSLASQCFYGQIQR
jgi:hypothetical protein